MFDKFTRTQKIAVILCLIIFFVVNAFSVALLIGQKLSRYSEPADDPINLVIKNANSLKNTKYKFGDLIDIDSGDFEIRTNGIYILGNGKSSFIIYNDLIDVKEGLVLVKTAKPIQLPVSNSNIQIPAESVLLYNAEEKFLINLSTKSVIKIDSIELSQNEEILLEKDAPMKAKSFDRTELTTNEKYKDLILSTKVFEQNIPELTDSIPPRLIKITPKSGESTANSKLRISGSTEVGAKIDINGSSVPIDLLGNFGKDVFLVSGENNVYLDIADEYGNTSEIILNYTLN